MKALKKVVHSEIAFGATIMICWIASAAYLSYSYEIIARMA